MLNEPLVILANGSFPTHPIPLQSLQEAQTIICCDGAAESLVSFGKTPDYIIGDLDSISENLKEQFREIIISKPDQNENDLRKAITFAEENGCTSLNILGASGKREDHLLANVFTVLEFAPHIKLTMQSDSGMFRRISGFEEISSFSGQQISLFCKNSDISMTTTNLKYNLINSNLTNLYCGSLNESVSDIFTIELSHGSLLLFQSYS
ncbi:MAG: thiamine diphosphokinase [Candidatus Marinimicrobia bacterium]|nr:thiamine diphosphokinase [Candidatus Neomarinimicrobiota bacterium]